MPTKSINDRYDLPPVFRERTPAWRNRRRPEPFSVTNARSRVCAGTSERMRFWVMSDLGIGRHGDGFVLRDLPARFDAMLVAGNVGAGMTASLDWLAALGDRLQGRPLILVPGPRDYATGLPPSETMRLAREAGERLGIAVLADASVRLPDGRGNAVHVIGATLWTDWALHGTYEAPSARAYARHAWSGALGITAEDGRPWGPHDAAGAHARSRAYIEDVLGSAVCQRQGFGSSPAALIAGVGSGDRVVVVTHHAPSPFSLAADWRGWCGDAWHAASYATDLGDIMDAWSAPSLWVHGGVPSPVDYQLGRTRVVANPRTHAGGPGTFDPALVVEV